jgi:hypothetical protein
LNDDTRSNVKKVSIDILSEQPSQLINRVQWTVTDPADPGSQGVTISTGGCFLKVESVPGDPVALSSLLSTTAHDTILLASNQPSDIDSLVEFYAP